jgi:hypothetical protein
MHRGFIALLFLVPAVAGGWAMHDMLPHDGPKLLAQVLRIVDSEAIDGLTQDEMYERAARGLVERLDDRYARSRACFRTRPRSVVACEQVIGWWR